jgi:predicted outer membrane repeat protein
VHVNGGTVGGGVTTSVVGTFTMNGGTIGGSGSGDGNSAGNGGGVYIGEYVEFGSLYNAGGTFTIAGAGCEIIGNTAAVDGGGIYTEDETYSNIDITAAGSVTFSGNTAGDFYKLKSAHKVDSPRTGGTPSGLFDGAVQGISLAPSSADSTDFNVLNFGAFALGVYGNGTWNYTAAVANKLSAYNNYDINYLNSITMATLILANRVTDDDPDKAKDFTFTLYFRDESGNPIADGGTPAYKGFVLQPGDLKWGDDTVWNTGSMSTAPIPQPPADGALPAIIEAPIGGTTAGMTTFTLKHGQVIEIEVPAGSVRIVQQTGWPYETTFWDDGALFTMNFEDGRDTGADTASIYVDADGFREMEEGDVRRFDFFNGWDSTPPTGINLGSPATAIPFAMIIGGLWLISRSINDLRRRRRTTWETS